MHVTRTIAADSDSNGIPIFFEERTPVFINQRPVCLEIMKDLKVLTTKPLRELRYTLYNRLIVSGPQNEGLSRVPTYNQAITQILTRQDF